MHCAILQSLLEYLDYNRTQHMPYILYSLLALTAIIISEHNSFRNNAYAETHEDSIIKIAQKYEKAHAFNGVLLVAEDGKVKYEGAFGVADRNWSIPHETNSRFMIASITKSHTAILVMQLVEEGLIALDDVISDHLSEFPAPYKDTITIHHLLSHRSGIPHYTQIPGWFTGEFLGEINDNEFLKIIGALPLNFVSGTEYRYSNSNYFILGKIIEKVTGKSYNDIIHQQIFTPLGMTSSGNMMNGTIIPKLSKSYTQDEKGTWVESGFVNMDRFVATGSLYSTAQDLFKLDQALYSEQLVSDESKAKLFNEDAAYGWSVFNEKFCNNTKEKDVISYNGGIEGSVSFIMRLPQERKTVIILSNSGIDYENIYNFATEIINISSCQL